MAPDGSQAGGSQAGGFDIDLRDVTLDDKYSLESGHVFASGIQALVRLPLMQIDRDRAAGLNTAGFISGYRGSPLGGYDQALWKARRHLKDRAIHFQPGINEDLAATSVWGSQQVGLFDGPKYDGVFGIWYGKGPGVDRSGDVMKHANFAGTAQYGGVLALAGDDHASKSSTVPHQSEHAFTAAMIPVLNPANVQEILDLGLHGIAMSRYSGLWVGFKTIAETCDSSASVAVDPGRVTIRLPEDFEMPPGGLNIRHEAHKPIEQEYRLMRYKLYASLAYARANGLNYQAFGGRNRSIGIVTVGKSYLDVLQALEVLGIDEATADALGLAVYKVGMPWPLEPEGIRRFAEGLDEIVVVEEKRALIENQMKEQLYNWHADKRPVVVGKFDEEHKWILPSVGELSPAQIAIAIGRRILKRSTHDGIAARVAELEAYAAAATAAKPALSRIPYFCSGCPHNTSTHVPEGSTALAGIGCHYMAVWMPERRTKTFTQMGGEGATWVGAAPFTETKHVFVNLGDGTYYHSGLLAIRHAIAAGSNITYKILYNDAVAMTGGQPVDGTMTPQQIAAELAAEGVKRLVVVSDEPEKYAGVSLPAYTEVAHRDRLDGIQRELRETQGVTVLLYDQTCAAEKRRRRKRGTFPDPDKRVFINDRVCEGCGDCGKASNCLSVVPLATEYGTKRAIDQSSCNKDFSCVKGFCPSFVTVSGATPRKPEAAGAEIDPAGVPDPVLPSLDRPFNMLVTGVGGTGVVTIGALLGMAAHLEGKGVSVLDQTGLAQKGGAVLSHLRIAAKPEDIHAVRVADGAADALIGCDLVVAASADSVARFDPKRTAAVVNRHEAPTGAFTQDPHMVFPGETLAGQIRDALGGAERLHLVEATRLATRLMGDSIATNLFMLGYAYQKGLVPITAKAIERAVELNGVGVAMNRAAFAWGRKAAVDPAAVSAAAKPAQTTAATHHAPSQTLGETVDRRVADLTAYQNADYAKRYRALVDRVAEAEARVSGPAATPLRPADRPFTAAVATYAYKVMAYKDEYEVARLYSDGTFLKQLEETFTGAPKITFHLAPPLLSRDDPDTGRPKKITFGPWMLRAFGLLARLKGLRGTRYDPFGGTEERRAERALRDRYIACIETVADGLTAEKLGLAIEIAEIPDHIRGYGPVKAETLATATARWDALMARWTDPSPARVEAAE